MIEQEKQKHKKRILLPNSYYHIYNRGNHKKLIFHSHQDYETFLSLQRKYFNTYDTLQLYAWCLMPNHFHYLVKTGAQPEDLPKLMQRFMTSYVIYFNAKYKQVGRLFQSRYKSKLLKNTKAVKTVYQYIKNNPVEALLCRRQEDYKWLWFGELPFTIFEKELVEKEMEKSVF